MPMYSNPPSTGPTCFMRVRPKVKAKDQIIRLFRTNTGKSAIIYCLSRKKVEEITELLQVNGIKALAYHAGMDSSTRSNNQDKFLMEEVDVIMQPSLLAWVSTNPMCGLWFTTTFPNRLKDSTRRQAARVATVVTDGASLLQLQGYPETGKIYAGETGCRAGNRETAVARYRCIRRIFPLSLRTILLHYFGEKIHHRKLRTLRQLPEPKKS